MAGVANLGRVLVAVVVLASLAGCGSDCLGLAQEYANELSYAQACDPAAGSDQCGSERPVVDNVQSGNQLIVDGLGSCMHSVNPAHISKLNDILSRYQGNGCKLLPLPFCTPVENRCYVNAQGHPVCWP